MQAKLRGKVGIVALAVIGTVGAFTLGALGGAALDHAMTLSVARVPMPILYSPTNSPVHTHVR